MYSGKIIREMKLCFTVPGNLTCIIPRLPKITALIILICRTEKLTKTEMKIIWMHWHSEGKTKPTTPPQNRKEQSHIFYPWY